MTLLPIVDRELRVRARLRGTYRFRLVTATGAILIVIVLLLGNLVFGSSPRLGTTIFITLAGLSFLFCLTEGARNTADCLSREKREGTLGLLFLTDLRGYDVVLGKLVATSINSFYGLLAIFPALAIPLVLGGVTVGEFWRHVLALLNALFLSLTVGLLVSTVSRDERRTWMVTSLAVFWMTVAPPFLLLTPTWSLAGWAAASPFTAFLGAFDKAFVANPSQFWSSIWVVQAISWVSLLAASVLLPYVWQDRPVRPARTERPRRSAAAQEMAARCRARQLELNPALWLAGRGTGPPGVLWVLVLAAGGIGLGAWLNSDGSGSIVAPVLLALFIVHVVLSIWVASESCHLIGVGRDTGSLDLLMATPLTTRQIVDGHLLAIRQMFFRPVAMLVAVELFIIGAHHFIVLAGEGLKFENLVVTAGMLLTLLASVLELQAVATFGLWMGLSTKRPAHAVTKTVAYVVFLPLVTFPCFPIYPVLATAKNLAFTNYGHDQLRRHLRAILTGRFDGGGRSDWLGASSDQRQRGQLPSVR